MPATMAPIRVGDAVVLLPALGACPKDVHLIVGDSKVGYAVASQAALQAERVFMQAARGAANRKAAAAAQRRAAAAKCRATAEAKRRATAEAKHLATAERGALAVGQRGRQGGQRAHGSANGQWRQVEGQPTEQVAGQTAVQAAGQAVEVAAVHVKVVAVQAVEVAAVQTKVATAVVPHARIVREVPTQKGMYPCALLLPRVVLVGDKTRAPHRVVFHNGTVALHNGRIFKLRDEGAVWTYEATAVAEANAKALLEADAKARDLSGATAFAETTALSEATASMSTTAQ